jgi:DHA2 family multidrug resistance protein-like MFS transporter
VGLVSAVTLVTEYAIGVAPAERAGSVSALVETAGELGGALGMAVLGSILGAVYALRLGVLLPAALPPAAREAALQTLGEAGVVAGQVGGAQGSAVLAAARTAYVDGMHVTDLVAAALLLGGAVVALAALPRHREAGRAEAPRGAVTVGRRVD